MFEIRRKVGLAREKVHRSISCLGKGVSHTSSPSPTFTTAQHTQVNLLTDPQWKVEVEKAQALMYQRVFNHPK